MCVLIFGCMYVNRMLPIKNHRYEEQATKIIMMRWEQWSTSKITSRMAEKESKTKKIYFENSEQQVMLEGIRVLTSSRTSARWSSRGHPGFEVLLAWLLFCSWRNLRIRITWMRVTHHTCIPAYLLAGVHTCILILHEYCSCQALCHWLMLLLLLRKK